MWVSHVNHQQMQVRLSFEVLAALMVLYAVEWEVARAAEVGWRRSVPSELPWSMRWTVDEVAHPVCPVRKRRTVGTEGKLGQRALFSAAAVEPTWVLGAPDGAACAMLEHGETAAHTSWA